ncbi:MAG: O-antigen ligase family protein [Chlamydiota bacterium]|nr:O-antigen ligase family protein [Chlamydiota bacterium]
MKQTKFLGKSHCLSLSPYLTFKTTLIYSAYCALYFLVLNTLNTRQRIKLVIWIIIFLGFFESLYGLMQYFSKTYTIFGYENPFAASATGTFINRNHYGAFLSLISWLTIGHASIYLSKLWIETETWKERALVFFSEHAYKAIFLIFAAGIMVLAIFYSGSRGALINFFCGLIIFFALCVAAGKLSKRVFIIFASLALMLICLLLWLGLWPLAYRWLSFFQNTADVSLLTRQALWSDTWDMVACFPIFGTGLGTYSKVFPLFQNKIPQHAFAAHAHSDYLEILSETGIMGITILGIGVVILYLRLIKMTKHLHVNDPDAFFYPAVIAGLSGFLIHCIFEFNAQIPAMIILLMIILGITEAKMKVIPKISESKKITSPIRQFCALIIIVVLFFSSLISMRILMSERALAQAKAEHVKQISDSERSKILYRLKRAYHHMPINPNLLYKLTQFRRAGYFSDIENLSTQETMDLMLNNINKALTFDPLNANYHMELGLLYLRYAKYQEKYQNNARYYEYLKKAESELNLALRYNLHDQTLVNQCMKHLKTIRDISREAAIHTKLAPDKNTRG